MSNEFSAIYNTVLAIFVIGFGLFLLLFMNTFIKGNVEVCKYLYRKTGSTIFKHYAEKVNSDSVRLSAYIAGIVFIVGGIQLLLTGSMSL
jgi:UPF0716 family protein affecting phage T7 exclusion